MLTKENKEKNVPKGELILKSDFDKEKNGDDADIKIQKELDDEEIKKEDEDFEKRFNVNIDIDKVENLDSYIENRDKL